jgi:hypothetical protein
MKKRFSLPALVIAVAIAGFLTLTMAPKSFAASQANKAGVSFSLSGQYLGIGEWSQNQAQAFMNNNTTPNQNSFQAFLQRLRLNTSVSYDKLAHGMPLAALFVQMDLTNAYNGITDGYGTNGYYMLGGTPAPTGFNNDFNTFGLRQAYIRLITPIGAIMFGRMPVKFGLGVAVNTNADGLGDFMPLGNIGIFAGTLFGSEVSAYDTVCNTSSGSTNCALPGTTEGYYPPAAAGYTHIQMGTIPTIEVMTMKPINNISYSAWLTEAHLNQFEAGLSSATTAYTGGSASGTYSANANINSVYPTANITFGGASVNYSNEGTKFAGEFDYFRGHIISSSQAFGYVGAPIYQSDIYFKGSSTGYPSPTYNLNDFLPVPASGNNQYDDISSYDLYLTGSQLLNTSTPMSLGFKFGIGAPIAEGDYNFTYYSTIQNTRTLFGDVIGSSWQPIQFNAPGLSYIYGGAAGEAVGPNLSNKYAIMVDAKEFLPSNNTLKESLIHAAWLQTQIGSTQEFGGSNIGTELDINFTHHFTKTLAWQAWASYVWTGSGVESASYTTTPYYSSTTQNSTTLLGYQTTDNGFANSQTKNITALGTDISWNF